MATHPLTPHILMSVNELSVLAQKVLAENGVLSRTDMPAQVQSALLSMLGTGDTTVVAKFLSAYDRTTQ